ncbi:MAG: AAA family ATPase [Chloroflexi bacterium]|nr:AAA family ATPase [Chloroflexota bacterium]
MSENPYNPLQPTRDPLMFFGREETLAAIQLHLVSGTNRHAVTILGQRGMGKSSLLSQIPLNIDERFVCVYIDLNQVELEDVTGFVAAVVDQIRAMLEVIEASTLRLPAFPNAADVDLLDWLAGEYLEVVLAAIRRSRHLVLMFDDVHLLFEAMEAGNLPAHFMTYLAVLLDRYDRLNMIAALDITYEARALQTPPFDNAQLHHRLTNLSPEQAEAVVTKPVEGLYEFEPPALRRVLELTGGHPFHLHSLCRLIYRLYEQERRVSTIAMVDIEAVYPAALEQAGDIVKPLWEHVRPNERLALTSLLDLRQHNPNEQFAPDALREWLSKTEYPLNGVQLAAALRGLEYLGIVQTNQQGEYAFSSGIQADWLTAYIVDAPAETVQRPPKLMPKPRLSRHTLTMIALGPVAAAIILGLALVLNDDDPSNDRSASTATLQLDIEATRQSDYVTQTAAAATSTATPTATWTPQPTFTATPQPPRRFGG